VFKSRKSQAFLVLSLLATMLAGFRYCQLKADTPTLISRKVLFSKPDYAMVRISPDGKWLSYLAPLDGILNIWLKNLETQEIKVITKDRNRGVQEYEWSFDNTHILFKTDSNGDENWQISKVNVETGVSTLLTPEKDVQARLFANSYLHPNKAIIGLNNRDPIYHDLYELDILSGKRTLILKNEQFRWFYFDDNLNIVFAQQTGEKGKTLYYKPIGKNKWELYRTVSAEDGLTTSPLEIHPSKDWYYWLDSEGSDKANLLQINLTTKERVILYKGEKANINKSWIDTLTKEILAIGEDYLRQTIMPTKKDIQADFQLLQNTGNGSLEVISTSLNNRKWVVVSTNDDKPLKYYLYSRDTKRMEFLFCRTKALADEALVKMQPVEIKSRDGLTLVSYLSLPKNRKPNQPIPMVLIVHGGPFGVRDEWGLNPEHQWLANRGYAVLSVNYRGSDGFGKHFVKAGYGEYGNKTQEDLIDAVNWAIKEKIADPKKIAIYGGSYGGYSALLGATMYPDVFACAVDIVGIANLITFVETVPAYWKTDSEWLKLWMGGDTTTKAGRAHLLSRSPIQYVDNIKKPLLVMHGANYPRVKKSESDQIVDIMKRKGIPVTYALFPDEGHGFIKPNNILAEVTVIEGFLHDHLGGEFEEPKDEIKNSSMQILAGKV
jgi:dipeptidyl aminopeptidase/acylaminoacyl peptidase